MKICYLNYYNPLSFHGGAERVIFKEAHLMAQAGHEVVIITTHNGKKMHKERLDNGKIEAWFLPDKSLGGNQLTRKFLNMFLSLNNPPLVRQVKQILRIEKPDILHIHNPGAISISVVNAAKQLGCEVVQTFHGYSFECPKGSLYKGSNVMCSNSLPVCKMYKRIFQKTAQKDDSIIAICSFVQERLLQAGYGADKITLIPNSFQSYHTKLAHTTVDNKEILFVGRMLKAKGVHVLIQASAKLKTVFNQTVVVNLIGDGEDKAYFESLAKSLRVKVNFLGNVSDNVLEERYAEAYMVVVPSLFPELFPMVVLEAMSYGKPVVASNIGGIPDLVRHGQTGFLCEPNDPVNLAHYIETLLTNEELAHNMGNEASKASQKFSDANHLEKLLTLYNQILTKGEILKNAEKPEFEIAKVQN